jgi:hypothetical protein
MVGGGRKRKTINFLFDKTLCPMYSELKVKIMKSGVVLTNQKNKKQRGIHENSMPYAGRSHTFVSCVPLCFLCICRMKDQANVPKIDLYGIGLPSWTLQLRKQNLVCAKEGLCGKLNRPLM